MPVSKARQLTFLLEVDLAYAAGIVDGEGSIYISHRKFSLEQNPRYTLYVRVAMCDPLVPEWLLKTFGGSCQLDTNRNPQSRNIYRWTIASRQALEMLKAIIPYMKTKHPQAARAIAFQNMKKQKGFYWRKAKPLAVVEAEGILATQIQKMNRRGI